MAEPLRATADRRQTSHKRGRLGFSKDSPGKDRLIGAASGPTRAINPHRRHGHKTCTGHTKRQPGLLTQQFGARQKSPIKRECRQNTSLCSANPALAGVNRNRGKIMVTCTRKKPQSVDDRLRWLAPHIDGYKTWLRKKGYREVTITENVRLLACWAEWLRTAGFDLGAIGAGFDASATVFKGGRTARAPRGAAALFISYLREKEVVPSPKRPPSAVETWPVLAAFRSWMREQRGDAKP